MQLLLPSEVPEPKKLKHRYYEQVHARIRKSEKDHNPIKELAMDKNCFMEPRESNFTCRHNSVSGILSISGIYTDQDIFSIKN